LRRYNVDAIKKRMVDMGVVAANTLTSQYQGVHNIPGKGCHSSTSQLNLTRLCH